MLKVRWNKKEESHLFTRRHHCCSRCSVPESTPVRDTENSPSASDDSSQASIANFIRELESWLVFWAVVIKRDGWRVLDETQTFSSDSTEQIMMFSSDSTVILIDRLMRACRQSCRPSSFMRVRWCVAPWGGGGCVAFKLRLDLSRASEEWPCSALKSPSTAYPSPQSLWRGGKLSASRSDGCGAWQAAVEVGTRGWWMFKDCAPLEESGLNWAESGRIRADAHQGVGASGLTLKKNRLAHLRGSSKRRRASAINPRLFLWGTEVTTFRVPRQEEYGNEITHVIALIELLSDSAHSSLLAWKKHYFINAI